MNALEWLRKAAAALGMALQPFLEMVAKMIPDLAQPIADLLSKIAAAIPDTELEPLAETIRQEVLAFAAGKILSKQHPSSFA